jgi:hypothetical protein
MHASIWPAAIRGAAIMVLIIASGHIPTGSDGFAWRIVALVVAVFVFTGIDVWNQAVRARRSKALGDD